MGTETALLGTGQRWKDYGALSIPLAEGPLHGMVANEHQSSFTCSRTTESLSFSLPFTLHPRS